MPRLAYGTRSTLVIVWIAPQARVVGSIRAVFGALASHTAGLPEMLRVGARLAPQASKPASVDTDLLNYLTKHRSLCHIRNFFGRAVCSLLRQPDFAP